VKFKPGELVRMKESGSVWEDAPISTANPPTPGSRMHWLNAGDVVLILDSQVGDESSIMRALHNGKQLIMWDDEVEKLGEQ
jgi:hypothetical protein